MKLIRLVLTIFLIGVGLPASAHDQLVNQSPAEGEIVEAGIVEVSLTFNQDILNLGDTGAEILVLDQAGFPQNPGCAVVEGRDAKVQLSMANPGVYSVAWRVVSADGHPITGGFDFEVVNSTGYEADPNFQFVDCPEPVLISEPEPESGGWYWVLWLSLGAVAVGLFFLLRPRREKL